MTKKQAFLRGMRDTIPMIVGATPFGLIFGAFAVTTANLSFWGAMGFSLFVFAGSAQFIGATLLAQNASIAIIVLTTFVVNVRHALYSASLAPYMKHLPQRWMVPLAFWLTDETYATVIGRWQEAEPESEHMAWYHLGSSVLMYTNWNFWTFMGIQFGALFPNADAWGLDFAMVVTFIGIVVPMLVNRPMIAAAVVAGSVGVPANGLPHNLGLILAAVLGIAAGYALETVQTRERVGLGWVTSAKESEAGGN